MVTINNATQSNITVGPNIETSNLIFYLDGANYPGSGTTWKDLSGNNCDGTLTNSPVYSSNNVGSFTFDGTTQFVDVINSSSFELITTEISVMTWINVASYGPHGFPGVLVKGITGGGSGGTVTSMLHGLRSSTDSYSVQYGQSPGGSLGTRASYVGITSLFGTWLCFTSTYDGANIKLYKDATLVDTVAQTSAIYNTGQNFVRVGSDNRLGGPRCFDGKIGMMLVYNKALDLPAIVKNYDAFRSRYFK